MRNLVMMQKCASANIKKWIVTPKMWIIAVVIAIFTNWNFSWVTAYSKASGIHISPWVFPFYISMPVMLVVYGFLTIVLYADAPFRDSFSSFLEIRVGRQNWIGGQCLYIVESAAIYTLYQYVVTLLTILPRIFLTTEWGELISRLALDDGIVRQYGIEPSGTYFALSIVEAYTPAAATLLALLLMWAVTIFIGMTMLAFNIVIGKDAGVVAAGFLVFLSYFSNYVGWLMFGNKIFFLSPVNWVSLGYINAGQGTQMPDLFYVFPILFVVIYMMAMLGTRIYSVKDW